MVAFNEGPVYAFRALRACIWSLGPIGNTQKNQAHYYRVASELSVATQKVLEIKPLLEKQQQIHRRFGE